MNDIEYHTCIRFHEFHTRGNLIDYVYVFDGDGCWSNIGKLGGVQGVSLNRNGCFERGTIMHEFIHALGYHHMHSHADRDKFVEIQFENIQDDAVDNFSPVDPGKFSDFGTGYDYFSVMHYKPTAFSKNGNDTIIPTDHRFEKVIGQREGLSSGDAERINIMYNCSQSNVGQQPSRIYPLLIKNL